MLRKKATPSLVVACVGVVLALGGTAVAGSLITGAKIKDGSITSKDLKDNSIKVSDLSDAAYSELSQTSGSSVAAGPQGPAGPTGPAGPAGAQGPQGPAGPAARASMVVAEASGTLCSGTSACSIGGVVAVCPAGTLPVSGGYYTDALNSTYVSGVYVDGTTKGWGVGADNYGANYTGEIVVEAYCSSAIERYTFPGGAQVTPSLMKSLQQKRLAARAS